MRRFAITVLSSGLFLSAMFPAAAQGVSGDPVHAPNSAYEVDLHGHTQMLCSIKRSDFGLNTVSWSMYVSDDVHLIIEAMFDQQKS